MKRLIIITANIAIKVALYPVVWTLMGLAYAYAYIVGDLPRQGPHRTP